MQRTLRTGLLLTGLVLTILSMVVPIPEHTQLKVLVFLLVALGVPHGALDLYIERKNMQGDLSGSDTVLKKYLLNILAYAILWYFLPLLALLIFILITAYHFGEIDWMGRTHAIGQRVMYFFIGLSWILYFLSINIQPAVRIFLYLGHAGIGENQWLRLAGRVAPLAAGTLALCYTILFFGRRYFYAKTSSFYYALLQLVVLLVICHFSPLWLGFGFYFGLWHSILSFDKIRINFQLPPGRRSWVELLQKAMPFSIMAWIGMLFVMFMFYHSEQATSLLSLLFITLSVLTLPHLQVFTKLKIPEADTQGNSKS